METVQFVSPCLLYKKNGDINLNSFLTVKKDYIVAKKTFQIHHYR